MGRAKQAMMEAEERGWDDLDTYVCAGCVGDAFLKSLVHEAVEAETCSYCKQESAEPIAAPASVLQEAIADAVFFYFNGPMEGGAPWDHEDFCHECVSTEDMLLTLGLVCNDDLLEDIRGSFINNAWVRTTLNDSASSHLYEEMSDLWDRFAQVVKQETRFFFTHRATHEECEYDAPYRPVAPPHQILWQVGKLINTLGLATKIPSGTKLYRVRERGPQDTWKPDAAHLGPPPVGIASAGRMNPAGISYFYLALEPETAVAEVLSRPPCAAALAGYKAVSDITVIDFSNTPSPIPSVFDARQRDLREDLLFIKYFVGEIGKPIYKDGREHVEYLPSQVFSEYLAKVFRTATGQPAQGLIYPSAVRPGGRNLVIFPPVPLYSDWGQLLVFEEACLHMIEDWFDLMTKIAPAR